MLVGFLVLKKESTQKNTYRIHAKVIRSTGKLVTYLLIVATNIIQQTNSVRMQKGS